MLPPFLKPYAAGSRATSIAVISSSFFFGAGDWVGTLAEAPLADSVVCWVIGFVWGELDFEFVGLLHAASARRGNAVMAIAIRFMAVCCGLVLSGGVSCRTPSPPTPDRGRGFDSGLRL